MSRLLVHRSVPLNKVELSPDSTRFAGLTIEGITIYDTATEEKASWLEIQPPSSHT